MKPRALSQIQVIIISSLLMLQAGWACRIIVPPYPWPPHPPLPPRLPAPAQNLAVESHQAMIEIDGHLARVTVQAEFHNPNPFAIEGTYLFPISQQAAVSSFSMTANGKTIEAELFDADKARGIYENIVRRQQDPALLEYLEQGLLRARVFPIDANKNVKIELVYEEILAQHGQLYRFTYPLLSAKPEGRQPVKQLHVRAKIKLRPAVGTVLTPEFDSTITRENGEAEVQFKATDYVPDRDFQILFGETNKQFGVDFLAYRRNGDGFFLLTLTPDAREQKQEISAKSLTFVFDSSGSMSGAKIKQARQALLFCIDNLNRRDTFNIIAFATDVQPLFDQPRPVTEETQNQAREFIAQLKARGGTAINDALQFAIKSQPDEDRVPMIVFLTDGMPTIGEVNPDKILANLPESMQRRIFSFGVGHDVNTRLLDGLAAKAKGANSYVRSNENLELILSDFYDRISYPVMTDLELDAGSVQITAAIPRELPDLFKNSQLHVLGRFTGEGRRAMALFGKTSGEREKFTFEADLQGDPRNAFIPRQWAIARVGFLQEQIRLHGSSQELVDEVKQLGRDYGIITPHTSFLIAEQGMTAPQAQQVRRAWREMETQAAADTGAAAFESARQAQRMKSGAPGIDRDASVVFSQTMEQAGIQDIQLGELVTRIHDKTFYYRKSDDTWYDAAIPADQSPTADREIQAWSDEFFDILRQYPLLRKYVRAGKKLMVNIAGQIMRITE